MLYQANYKMKIGNDNSLHHPEYKCKQKSAQNTTMSCDLHA